MALLAEVQRSLVLLLAPFAPYLAHELWEMLGETGNLLKAPWPKFDAELAKEEELEIPVQINGKLRGRIEVGANAGRQEIEALARQEAAEWLQGKVPKKIVYVEKKLVNFVV